MSVIEETEPTTKTSMMGIANIRRLSLFASSANITVGRFPSFWSVSIPLASVRCWLRGHDLAHWAAFPLTVLLHEAA